MIDKCANLIYVLTWDDLFNVLHKIKVGLSCVTAFFNKKVLLLKNLLTL